MSDGFRRERIRAIFCYCCFYSTDETLARFPSTDLYRFYSYASVRQYLVYRKSLCRMPHAKAWDKIKCAANVTFDLPWLHAQPHHFDCCSVTSTRDTFRSLHKHNWQRVESLTAVHFTRKFWFWCDGSGSASHGRRRISTACTTLPSHTTTEENFHMPNFRV